MPHTPGPWKVADTSIVTDDYCIAVVEDDGGYEAPWEERKANARLLAAAPDLLKACKALLEDLAETACLSVQEFAADSEIGEAALAAIAEVEKGD